ncbi:MAG: MFS transporter [Lentisphaerae bacterium]|nr:MFS transporter [Lentisphaerota bacterium]
MTDPSPSADLTPAERRTGMRNIYFSQVLGAHLFMFLSASAIMPLFVKRLGGSDLQAMLPSAFVSLVTFAQVPVAMFIRPLNIPRFLVRCWATSSAVMLVGLALVLARAPGQATVMLLLAAILASQLLLQIGGTFWFPLLHDVVPPEQRGRFFGTMRALWYSAYLVLGVAAGMFLGQNPAPWKFTVVLSVVTVLQFLREPFVARIPQRRRVADAFDWRADFAAVWRNRSLLVFLGYFTLLMFLAGFIGQPTVLYMRQLGFSTGHNTVIYAMSAVGNVLSLLVAGVLLDRVGTKRVFRWVHLILCALAGSLVVAGELPATVAGPLITGLLIASGAALASANLASTAQIFHFAPEQGKPFYMSLSVAVTTLGSALAPVCTGALLDSRWGGQVFVLGRLDLSALQVLFLLAAAGLLLAMGLLPLVSDVRAGGAAELEVTARE